MHCPADAFAFSAFLRVPASSAFAFPASADDVYAGVIANRRQRGLHVWAWYACIPCPLLPADAPSAEGLLHGTMPNQAQTC